MGLVRAEEMKKRDQQDRELKENMLNLAVRKNWWKFVQSVESIRHDLDNKVAIFWLGTSLQSLIDLSLEFGDRRVEEAIPPEQRDLFVMILADGEELAATALEEQTRLFGEWEFPPADEVFHLVQEAAFGKPGK
jgi:hypothetical protein